MLLSCELWQTSPRRWSEADGYAPGNTLCIATQKIWGRRQLTKENLTAWSTTLFWERGQKELMKTETAVPPVYYLCIYLSVYSFYFLLGRRERKKIWIICVVLPKGTQQSGPEFWHVLGSRKWNISFTKLMASYLQIPNGPQTPSSIVSQRNQATRTTACSLYSLLVRI